MANAFVKWVNINCRIQNIVNYVDSGVEIVMLKIVISVNKIF